MTYEPLDLDDLREAWKIAVIFGEQHETPWSNARPPRPCWFGENVPGIDACEYGDRGVEGAHWIKRQRVEKTMARQLAIAEIVCSPSWQRRCWPPEGLHEPIPEFFYQVELVYLAAWDPRNGVPACEKHHRRFDGHMVDARDPLVIWRHEVPGHVEAFCRDWPFETALEDRNPAIGAGI